jgi:ankyrin repeat protein
LNKAITQHGTIYPKTSIDQRIIESSNMKSLAAGERDPECLISPLFRQHWKTALTVILHSSHWTKRRVHTWEDSPLHVAIRSGAPVEVVTALLEAYSEATTIQDYNNELPCHFACSYGISSEGMKMLLRCNPDALDAITNTGGSPMHRLNSYKWQFFADEKEQVRNDLKQLPSYWKSKEQQALLQCALEETDRRHSMRRSVARIILGRQFDNFDLVALVIEYL